MDFRNDINIDSKINEAEVCRNMGLHQDAVAIYEMVIAELPPHESQQRDRFQKQITLLQKEINSRDKVDPGSITDGYIDIKFFLHLSDQTLLRGFMNLDFTAWKFPLAG